jgi:lipopolysaccharide/colanic/teichoic acid biosynthesis glycosyltransferase
VTRVRTFPLPLVAVRGPAGRLLERLYLKRAPYLWSVLRGDLHWVGTTPRTSVQTATLVERGGDMPARPGLVTLADVAPLGLRWHDRLVLDRLYAETRSRFGDLQLLGAALRTRLGLLVGLASGRASS